MSGVREADDMRAQSDHNKEIRDKFDKRVLDIVCKHTEENPIYSVEIKGALGAYATRLGRISTSLRRLEEKELLCSELRTTVTHPDLVKSGTGRRYYWPA